MTLLEMKIELYRHVGRDDSDTEALLLRGINAGIIAATLIFEPTEQQTSDTLVAVNTGKTVALSGLTRWLKLDKVYNATEDGLVWPLEFDALNLLWLPTTGRVLYYALYGETMHYRPQPAGNENLTVYFLQYPVRVVNDTDEIPLERYEEFIMSFASEYFWASQEETEAVDVWQKMSDRLAMPLQVLQRARKLTRMEVPNGDNVRGAVP